MSSQYGRYLRKLYTLVCVGVLAVFAAPPATAQDTRASTVHPVLETRPPRDVLNSDLLALPDRERQAWIHGAMSQMVHALADQDSPLGQCALDWYFDAGNGVETIEAAIRRYPDQPPTGTILALLNRICPDN